MSSFWPFPSIGILDFLKTFNLGTYFCFAKWYNVKDLEKKQYLSFFLPQYKLQKICYLLSQFVFVSSFHHPFYTKWVQSISEVSIESKDNNIHIVE